MSGKIQVKCLVAILVLALSATAQAETPVVEWTRQLGTTSDDYGYGVSVDDSGNAYVTGCTEGGLDGNVNAGHGDMFLTKYDTNGNNIWTKQLGTDSLDIGNGVSVDNSGNAYVTGYTGGGLDGNTNVGRKDIFLTKYDTNGNKRWTRQLGTNDVDEGNDVSVDGSGNIYVTGWTWDDLDGNTNAGIGDMFLTKYDTNGNKIWTEQLGSDTWDFGYGVSVDGSGNAYVTGCTKGDLDGNTSAGMRDMFLAKYDTDGNKMWTKQLGSASEDKGYGVSVDGNGNAYVTGYTEGGLGGNTSAGGSDMFLVKISTVPEPGSIAMLAGIALTALLYRKRTHV